MTEPLLPHLHHDDDGLEPLLQVLSPEFSRNRHFEFFKSAEGRALFAFRQLVQGFLADLERGGPETCIWYEPDGEQFRLELTLEKFRVTRHSWVSPRELEVLKRHGPLSTRLRARGVVEGEPHAHVTLPSDPP